MHVPYVLSAILKTCKYKFELNKSKIKSIKKLSIKKKLMMNKEMNKLRYEAPMMEATGFKTENGYAVSEPVMNSSAKITMSGSVL